MLSSGSKILRYGPVQTRGENNSLMPGEEMTCVEDMEKEGWVFSEGLDGLEATDVTNGDSVFGFVE